MEAFECYICRKVMALFGADSSRCPGCGAVHGRLITKDHIVEGAKTGTRRARTERRPRKR